MQYYELFSNLHIRGRWHLGTPLDTHGQEVDPWQFDEGRPLGIQETLQQLPVTRPGRALDFTLTGLAIPSSLQKSYHFLKDSEFNIRSNFFQHR